MIFAINAPADGENSFANFQKKALEFGQKEAGSSLAPSATPTYAATNTPATYSLPAPTPNASGGTQYRVLVGPNNTLTYYPQFVAAKPKDTIVCETGP